MIDLNFIIEFYSTSYSAVITNSKFVTVWTNCEFVREGEFFNFTKNSDMPLPAAGKRYTLIQFEDNILKMPPDIACYRGDDGNFAFACVNRFVCEDGTFYAVRFLSEQEAGEISRASRMREVVDYHIKAIASSTKYLSDIINIHTDSRDGSSTDIQNEEIGILKKILSHTEDINYFISNAEYSEMTEIVEVMREITEEMRKISPNFAVELNYRDTKSNTAGIFVKIPEYDFVVAVSNIFSRAAELSEGMLDVTIKRDSSLVALEFVYKLKDIGNTAAAAAEVSILGGGAARHIIELTGGGIEVHRDNRQVSVTFRMPHRMPPRAALNCSISNIYEKSERMNPLRVRMFGIK